MSQKQYILVLTEQEINELHDLLSDAYIYNNEHQYVYGLQVVARFRERLQHRKLISFRSGQDLSSGDNT